MIELSFDRRAGRSWLLFKPWTWLTPLPRPEAAGGGIVGGVAPHDPANPKRSDTWAQRKKNETWSALIAVWSEVLSPADPTELSVSSPSGEPVGRIIIGRTNAYSRPA